MKIFQVIGVAGQQIRHISQGRLMGVVELDQVLRYIQLRERLRVPLTTAGSATAG